VGRYWIATVPPESPIDTITRNRIGLVDGKCIVNLDFLFLNPLRFPTLYEDADDSPSASIQSRVLSSWMA